MCLDQVECEPVFGVLSGLWELDWEVLVTVGTSIP